MDALINWVDDRGVGVSMFVTVMRKTRSGLKNTNLSLVHIFAFCSFVFVAVPVFFTWTGYNISQRDLIRLQSFQAEAKNWQHQFEVERAKFSEYRESSERHLDGLAAKVGALQAEINRINAVGKRILELNGLDGGEFNFELDPPVGGLFIELHSNIPEEHSSVTDVSFDETLTAMAVSLDSSHQQYKLIESLLLDSQLGAEKYVSGRPIKKGWMSSGYGKRIDPFNGKQAWHEGVDFAGKTGSPIIATASGVVIAAGKRYGYGLVVEVSHGNGITTRYAHCKKTLVKKGDLVTKGQILAEMGSSGRSTGPHVHYEVLKNGKPVNPLKYVYRKAKKTLSDWLLR